MTRIALFSGTARVAITGLLLGASTIAVAQETAPVAEPMIAPIVAPQPAPVAVEPAPQPVATPAPASEPVASDNIAPSALGDIALERAEQRQAARERAAATRTQRQAVAPASTIAQPSAAIAPDAPVIAPEPVETGIADNSLEVTPVTEAPIDNNVAEPVEPAEDNINDWLLIAGVVGAAGLAGGAALAATRRRRRVARPAQVEPATVPVATVTPETKAWAAMPVSEPVAPAADPVFARSATTAPSFDPLFAARPATAISADPLFAPRNEPEIPVTDPLFSRKVEVPPVTDPMFSHLPEFQGQGAKQSSSWAFDSRRNWADNRQSAENPRELEPAE